MKISCGRWFLKMKVVLFRLLMAIGMKFHHRSDPKSPQPNFIITIPSRLSVKAGQFKLIFYVPDGYFEASEGYKYPFVVNYHGGGFTIGTGTDDAKWASYVVKNVNAVFVSVEYRLAPEFPFSVGLEDGTDAIIYLASHAEELRLDPHRIALSGFSAGGNFTFAIPLMLHDLKNHVVKKYLGRFNNTQQFSSCTPTVKPTCLLSSSKTIYKYNELMPTELETNQRFPNFSIKCIASFYPVLDFRVSRAAKIAKNPKPEKSLPTFVTNMFHESYMYPRDEIDVADPYLSPAAATDNLLKVAYPEDIVLYTCEYDMLNEEGIVFAERLSGPQIGKTVRGSMIKNVVHGFDKMPNQKEIFESIDKCYSETCNELLRVFGCTIYLEEKSVLDSGKVEVEVDAVVKTIAGNDRAENYNEQVDNEPGLIK